MEYYEFIEAVKEKLQDICGDEFVIEAAQTMKNNSVMFRGISIREKDSKIAPTIYLEDLYTDHCDGRDFEEIVNEVLRIYSVSRKGPDFDAGLFSDFSWVRDRIFCKLINCRANAGLLSEVPHYRFLDLAVIYCVLADDNDGTISSITIKNDHLKLWETDEEEIRKCAIRNTPVLLPASIVSIGQILNDMVGADPVYSDSIPMYVLTNKNRSNGATAMLYNDVIGDFADNIHSDLYIIPSSVHELILVPDTDEMDPDVLSGMIAEVNDTQLAPEELLSYSLYRYSRADQSIRIAGADKKAAAY